MYQCTSKMQASPNPLAVYANMVVNEFHKASISKNSALQIFYGEGGTFSTFVRPQESTQWL